MIQINPVILGRFGRHLSAMNFLIRACLGGGAPQAPATRLRCGTISGAAGIFLNVLLFLGKVIAGTLTSSVAMVADAVNNLSDAATSVVTLIGFRARWPGGGRGPPLRPRARGIYCRTDRGDGYSAHGGGGGPVCPWSPCSASLKLNFRQWLWSF